MDEKIDSSKIKASEEKKSNDAEKAAEVQSGAKIYDKAPLTDDNLADSVDVAKLSILEQLFRPNADNNEDEVKDFDKIFSPTMSLISESLSQFITKEIDVQYFKFTESSGTAILNEAKQNDILVSFSSDAWGGDVYFLVTNKLLNLWIYACYGASKLQGDLSKEVCVLSTGNKITCTTIIENIADTFNGYLQSRETNNLKFKDLNLVENPPARLNRPSIFYHCRIAIQIEGLEGDLYLILPHGSHRGLMDLFSKRVETNLSASDQLWRKSLYQGIQKTSVKIDACLDLHSMSLSQISQFKVGQILPLKSKDLNSVNLVTKGDGEGCKTLCRGTIGRSDGKLSVKIDEIMPQNYTEE